MSRTLRQMVEGDDLLIAPGVFDGLSALIAREAGFEAMYVSGGAVARSSGLPDLGLLSMSEVRDRVALICEVGGIPAIVDIDTGYGNALNVYRTVSIFVRAGASAIQIEDQIFPKRCGHYLNKSLIAAKEMVGKVKAAVDARGDDDIPIIARTDAIAVEGLDKALDRAHLYREAGADIIFVEAPESDLQLKEIPRRLPHVPLVVNMFGGGLTPQTPVKSLADMGYSLVIIPSDLQRASIFAMRHAAAEMMRQGDTAGISKLLTTFAARDELVDMSTWERRELMYSVDNGRPL